MNKVLLIFCGLFCLIGADADAASRSFLLQKCQETMAENPPDVEVVYSFGNLEYDDTIKTADLRKNYAELFPERTSKQTVYGLTYYDIYEKIGVSLKYEPVSDKYRCFYPTRVVLVVGYENTKIYLDSAMEKDSCLYRRSLRHEQMHVDLAHTSLKLYAMALKARINAIINEAGPQISQDDPEEITDSFIQEYQIRLTAFSELFKATLVEYQFKMDSEENYLAEQKLCPN